MFEDGDWAVLLRNNGNNAGLKGQIFKLRKPLFPLVRPQWIIETSPGNLALVDENILKPVSTITTYGIYYSEWSARNNVWSLPRYFHVDDLEGFRREVRGFEREPMNYRVLAKKKITVPYQDPNGEVIEMDEVAPAVPVQDEEPMDDFEPDFDDEDEEEEER